MREEDAFNIPDDELFLSDKELSKLANPVYDLEEDKGKQKNALKTAHRNFMDVLRKYCDIKEEYYNIISLWIIGTYFHKNFPTYPYLFINAMKGSGKSRLLRLIVKCSRNGSLLNSLTEAVLFRTDGTLGIDEFEGMSRKGNEALKELLNSSYKKGITVKRLKKRMSRDGEEQVVEEFDVYRPIIMANIGGIESVLADRCITFILDKSGKRNVTDKLELFDYEQKLIESKKMLYNLLKNKQECRLCSVGALRKLYTEWNIYTDSIYTIYTNNIHYTNLTPYTHLFDKIKETKISGRDLELTFPLFIIAEEIGILDETIEQVKEIIKDKKEEDSIEAVDVSFIDFISQENDDGKFLRVNEITRRFKEYLQSSDEWINDAWIGKALKRLSLTKIKRRSARGVQVILNVPKAQEKLKLFKE